MQRRSLVWLVLAVVMVLVGVTSIALAFTMPSGLGLTEDPAGGGMLAWSNVAVGVIALLTAAWAGWKALPGRR